MRNLDCCRCWRCTLCPCKVRNKFLVNFWNHTIHLCIPCVFRVLDVYSLLIDFCLKINVVLFYCFHSPTYFCLYNLPENVLFNPKHVKNVSSTNSIVLYCIVQHIFCLSQKWNYLEFYIINKSTAANENIFFCYHVDQSASLDIFLRQGNEFISDLIHLFTFTCGEQSYWTVGFVPTFCYSNKCSLPRVSSVITLPPIALQL